MGADNTGEFPQPEPKEPSHEMGASRPPEGSSGKKREQPPETGPGESGAATPEMTPEMMEQEDIAFLKEASPEDLSDIVRDWRNKGNPRGKLEELLRKSGHDPESLLQGIDFSEEAVAADAAKRVEEMKRKHAAFVASIPAEERGSYVDAIHEMQHTEGETMTPEKAFKIVELANSWGRKGGNPRIMLLEAGRTPEEIDHIIQSSQMAKDIEATPEEEKTITGLEKLANKDATVADLQAIAQELRNEGMTPAEMKLTLEASGRTEKEIEEIIGQIEPAEGEKEEDKETPPEMLENAGKELAEIGEIVGTPSADLDLGTVEKTITKGQGLLAKIMDMRNSNEFKKRRIWKFILYTLAIMLFTYITALRGISNGLVKAGGR